MSLLDVNTAGLHALAAKCTGWSAELTQTPPSAAGVSAQPSAVAVNLVHADAALAGEALAARMQSTAAKLAQAGAQYGANEAGSSTELTNLAIDL
ncbi:hypothetical protein [Mycolicibacterium sphagni]|uniref:hypothetical protein n=1 Tax=Mycolicibacterium sphagni TaxID=1786 RepID=UPI0021F35484|nr:hypothetical protein [Mycolicibacterium sphagni]MCV7177406.1 hypothetical protein [Mycolicibacterium sphagni]